jgi:nucleoside-diphosphate-sugar epimerase
MRLFVTGGTGFIGSNFINAAMLSGHDVIALRRNNSKPRMKLINEPTWINGRMSDDLQEALSDCDVLVHLASTGVSPQLTTWGECFSVNVTDSLILFENAINAGIDKLLIAGTSLEYGRSALRFDNIPCDAPLEPIGPYANSRASSFIAYRGLAIDKKVKLMYLRIFQAFGDGQHNENLWPSLRISAMKGNNFSMTSGEQIRDFIHVGDVSEKFVNCISDFKNLSFGDVVVKNIGSGSPQTVREFAEYWWSYWNAKGDLLLGDVPYRKDEIMRLIPEI